MKSRVLIVFLTAILTASCTPPAPTNPPKQVNQTRNQAAWTPASKPTPNPFDSVSFPQETCGDKLPDDAGAYPVKLYPVFIEYSERNLLEVKTKFCRDALKIFRIKTGKDAIQVASFVGLERATQFKEWMANQLGSGGVGEPTVIEARPKDELAQTRYINKETIGKAAGFTPSQINQLVSLEKRETIKVVVPTYVPPGFLVDKVEIKTEKFSTKYKIKYRNSQNLCFEVADYGPIGDGGFSHDVITNIYSPALGYVKLGYTKFHRLAGGTIVSFPAPIFIDADGKVNTNHLHKTGYNFIFYSATEKGCNAISFQEAAKIVESLQYLNPPLTSRSSTYNP